MFCLLAYQILAHHILPRNTLAIPPPPLGDRHLVTVSLPLLGDRRALGGGRFQRGGGYELGWRSNPPQTTGCHESRVAGWA